MKRRKWTEMRADEPRPYLVTPWVSGKGVGFYYGV
jgi:hypothetical protein